MDEIITKIRKNKYILMCHVISYVAVMLFTSTYFFELDLYSLGKYIAIVVLFLVFLQFEFFFCRKDLPAKREFKLGVVYYVCRLAAVMVFYFLAPSKYEGLIFLVLMLLFAVESTLVISFVPYDDRGRRSGCYAGFALLYGMVSLIILISLLSTGQIGIKSFLRELSVICTVILILIIICEIIASIWNAFEARLFAQNRAVSDLNEANKTLHEHQEKISKVNELLGVQKIELQVTNKKINRSHDEMSVQNEISSNIAASLGKEDLLQQVTKIMHIRLDLDMVMVVLEPDNSLLVPGEEPQGRFAAISTSLGEDFEKAVLDSVHKTDLRELLLLSKTYIQNSGTDTLKFFKYLSAEQELPSVICLPIFKQEERLGTLIVGKNKENAFMDSRAFYENIASQLSIGISNARLYAKMNDMAIRDGLTRIYNRRHLSELLNEYLMEAMKRRVPVSLALFDIDKFKMVNDTYGHQCGDAVICHVATLLNKGHWLMAE